MSNVPATTQSMQLPEGLEDLTPADLGVPRITIDHTDAVFFDKMAGINYPELTVVMLGVVKQRSLWPPNLGDEGDAPLCRSNDAKVGFPGEEFPWDDENIVKAGIGECDSLSCSECPLKDWGTHPTREEQPWCAEQYTFPLLLVTDNGASPVLLTVSKTAIKPAKAYLGGFARDGKPTYEVYTHITLDAKKRGQNRYAVPSFKRGEATDPESHEACLATYRSMRDFLHSRTGAGGGTEGDEAPDDTENVTVAEAAADAGVADAPAPAKPKAAPKAPTGGKAKKDDVPF